MRTISKSSLINSLIFFGLFMPLCILYYIWCNTIFPETAGIGNFVNEHDHLIYTSTIQHIGEGNILLSINNDVGISLIYILIKKGFAIVGITDIILIAFIVNLVTLYFVFIYYMRICEKLKMNGLTKLFFFLGLQLLYFTQLINKDMLTILFFLLILNCLLNAQYKAIFILSLLFFFVRIQLLIFGFIAIYLSFGNIRYRLLIIYIITSIIAAYTTVNASIISSESIGDGLSGFLISFNQNFFYSGYIIFNPVRVLQFVIDIYMSFNIFTEGLVDVAKIQRLPLLIGLLMYIAPLFYSVKYFKNYFEKTNIKGVYIIIFSFTLTWLMNPTVNARYIMLVVPFLLILGRFVKLNDKRFT